MARSARLLAGRHGIELRHPLMLWQRGVHSASVAQRARLLLVDIAAERAHAAAARPAPGHRMAEEADAPKRDAERWRRVAAGVSVGDAACLLGLARGLLAERRDGRLEKDCLDAVLSALAMAARAGTATESTVACLELLMTLPEVIGGDRSRTGRGRALASLFRAYRQLLWTASGRNGRDALRLMSGMVQALATVEAAAIRRGLFLTELDRDALIGRMTDLLAAEPP